MWVTLVLLAFVMPVMAFVPLARASHGVALANVPRHAASNRPHMGSGGCCPCCPSDCTCCDNGCQCQVAPSASVGTSSGKDGKKSRGCCSCCPSDCTCCDNGCQCNA